LFLQVLNPLVGDGDGTFFQAEIAVGGLLLLAGLPQGVAKLSGRLGRRVGGKRCGIEKQGEKDAG
jgi:hypothetical protein